MKIEKDLACVTKVEILPIGEIQNEVPLASNIEIKQDFEEHNLENSNSAEEASSKVPYILNGELYQILARKGENVTVKCHFCPTGRFYRGSVRSTGNFHMHIKRRHPYLLSRLHDMKVASLLERRDRLTKNRKNKRQRRIPFKLMQKEEDPQDTLKIKRAFQRHQAEANGTNYVTQSTEADNGAQRFEEFSLKKEHSTQFIETLPNHSDKVIGGNVYFDIHMSGVTENSTETTPPPTPYPSPYDGSAFGGFNSPPPAAHHVEIEAEDVERPLDLSLNGAHSSGVGSPAELNPYESSGIGLGGIYSDTTVANTVSTIKSVSDNHVTPAMLQNFSDPNWQQLSLTLRDLHNDLSIRNRIEHNRLLLDIAKFKFLHPGFYFNLQE